VSVHTRFTRATIRLPTPTPTLAPPLVAIVIVVTITTTTTQYATTITTTYTTTTTTIIITATQVTAARVIPMAIPIKMAAKFLRSFLPLARSLSLLAVPSSFPCVHPVYLYPWLRFSFDFATFMSVGCTTVSCHC
jgi:hypothetical protein